MNTFADFAEHSLSVPLCRLERTGINGEWGADDDERGPIAGGLDRLFECQAADGLHWNLNRSDHVSELDERVGGIESTLATQVAEIVTNMVNDLITTQIGKFSCSIHHV